MQQQVINATCGWIICLSGYFAGTVLPKSYELVRQGKRSLQRFELQHFGVQQLPDIKATNHPLQAFFFPSENSSASLPVPSHIINKFKRAPKAHNGCHRYPISPLYSGNCFPWQICRRRYQYCPRLAAYPIL